MTRGDTIDLYRQVVNGDNAARHVLQRRQRFLDEITIEEVISKHKAGVPNGDHARTQKRTRFYSR